MTPKPDIIDTNGVSICNETLGDGRSETIGRACDEDARHHRKCKFAFTGLDEIRGREEEGGLQSLWRHCIMLIQDS